ncbi:type I secretion protein TolC [Novosphingobium umbonatum]|uniref:Type I secretion protein TolC n=1 Tax=Novosphingobium umbonatum TaxID=1908524 RepID=A0A3S2X4P2_9SPHN|nr:TolC family protein [Novosphingobium umbonatum]RVU05691.1 type I secretion protein TolC [Novosphingobium umbonatum]
MRRLTGLWLVPLLLYGPLAQAQEPAQDLTATIAQALRHAPALDQAQAEADAARARKEGVRAETLPLVSLQGQIGYGRIDNDGFFGIGPKNVMPLAVQAGAEMPIYSGGRWKAAQDQARGGLDLARLGQDEARAQVTLAAVTAYVEVLSARQIELRFRQLTQELTEVARQAQLRYQSGEVPSSELAAATARRAEGEAGLAQAEGRRISALAQYRRITGEGAPDHLPMPDLPPVPATLDEAMEAAQRNNPALAQAEKSVDIARAQARAAQAEAMPSISAFTEASHTRDQFFPDYRANTVSLGLRGRWVLWSGGRISAKRAEADAHLSGMQARAREAHEAMDSAVIAAWTGLQTAHRMVAASEARSTAAAEALRSIRLEAKVGAKPQLALLDAEREAITAQTSAIEAQGQRLLAAWQLNALTGRLP